MQPFLVLIVIAAPLAPLVGWWAALRFGLAAMFLLTASAHWGKRRADLIRMVPPRLPRPDLLVTFTGLCELAGAAGLLAPRLAPAAATGLALLLVAVFPANIRAARTSIAIAGRPATPLPARAAIQLAFLAATLAVAMGAPA